MLTLVTAIWYVCGALFLLYVTVCAAFITVFEREVNKRSQALWSACKELWAFCENDMYIAKNDINSLSRAFAAICRSSPCAAVSFDFYRQKQIVEKAAKEYNEAAQRYNELAKGFPACVVARIMSKSAALMFLYE